LLIYGVRTNKPPVPAPANGGRTTARIDDCGQHAKQWSVYPALNDIAHAGNRDRWSPPGNSARTITAGWRTAVARFLAAAMATALPDS